MKKLPLILACLFMLILQSCSDDDPVFRMDDWILDMDDPVDIRTINTGENIHLTLSLSTNDLCAANGVTVLIKVNGELVHNELIDTFDYTLELDVPKDAEVRIDTIIDIIPNSSINCVTLGSVECSLSY